jgi:hypothetical protein
MLAIPASVLVDICKAIDGDGEAKEKAAEVMIPIIPPFSRNLSKVIMNISDTEVRRSPQLRNDIPQGSAMYDTSEVVRQLFPIVANLEIPERR